MFAEELSKYIVDHVSQAALTVLLPVMFIAFAAGVTLRVLLYYTVRAENRFATEVEKRAQAYLLRPKHERESSFYKTIKTLLEQTYYETFELRQRYQRRNLDHVATVTDRFFLIEAAVSRLVKDTLKQIRYLRKDGPAPRMTDVSKAVFDRNPVFNRLLGVLPVGLVNEFLNILPGLFVIGGIFGTFLGISKGLPELGNMNLADMAATKSVMDTFLLKIAYSMAASILGIFLSVSMSLINTALGADGAYYDTINRYSHALEFVWNETATNDWDRADAEGEDPAERPRTGATAARDRRESRGPSDQAA